VDKDNLQSMDTIKEFANNTDSDLSIMENGDHCIMWGDSISNKVEEGLKNCERTVVVISKKIFW